MIARHAVELNRVLLGTAIVVKGCFWPAAPQTIALVFIVSGLLAVASARFARFGFATVAALSWMLLVSDQYYANHAYLLATMSTLAVFVAPQPDASRTRPGPRAAHLLMMVQVATVYFWAGAWKINAAFLTGSILTLEWRASWLLGDLGLDTPLLEVLAAGTIVIEITLAALLWSRRLVVPWAVGLGSVLHLGMVLTVGRSTTITAKLVVFALLCASTYPLFVQRATRADAPTGPPSGERGCGPSRTRPRPPRRAATTAP
ncbi:MAG: HTTM domain-containing protein [Acidimicrobiales bacterium]